MGRTLTRFWRTARAMYGPFWRVWLAYLFVAIVGLVVLLLQEAFPGTACTVGSAALPWTQCYLGDSTSTPWGVVTAIFVHTSFAHHYLPNMVLLFAVVFIFCVSNALLPRSEKVFRQRVFLAVMFLAAIAANAASLVVYGPIPSVGSSGLDFAALGVLLVFCAVNVLPRNAMRTRDGSYYGDPVNMVSATFNGLVATGLVSIAVLDPGAFLSERPGVNVLVHVCSFVFAIGFTVGCTLGAPRSHRARVRGPAGA